MNKTSIAKDTLLLTGISLFLQGLSLVLNIYITKTLGAVNVGIVTLIGTFYGLAAVIAGGNIFICTNRMVSGEMALENGNYQKIFTYAMIFCQTLSITVTGIIFYFADFIGAELIKMPESASAIRILALSIPVGTISNCIKGFFHARRNITPPAIVDCIEFIVRIMLLVFFIQFFIVSGKISVYLGFALAVTISTVVNMVLMTILFCCEDIKKSENKASMSFGKFLLMSFPIAMNSYIISILGSANDALIPLTLKQFGNSTADALSKFGLFEAIVLPVLFFPSVIVQCLSCILLPEISRANAEGNENKVRHLTKKALRRTLYYSIIVMVVMLCFGGKIGELMSNGELDGGIITVMAPVIPLIYVEIVLEGILRGLGKYTFSTLNYTIEYIVRISVLLICVPLIGFPGIVVSYILSNVVGNFSRFKTIIKIIDVKLSELIFI